MRKWLLMAATLIVLITGVYIGTVCAGAATTEVVTADETLTADEAEANDDANSWRYSDGEAIEQKATMSLNTASSSSSNNYTLKGIDVSKYQGTINWTKVKAAGINFAIIRCGYGMNYTSQDDSQFKRNVSECERLGIPYGVYIYSYATTTAKASSEADHVLRLIKGCDLSFPVYYDMEDSSTIGSDYASIAKTFCNKIKAAGYPVGVYANLHWWNTYLTNSCFNNWYRWVAQYNSRCSYTKTYAMWQYSSSGSVNGITGRVDMNYLNGYPEDHGIYTTSVTEGTYSLSSKADSSQNLAVTASGDNANVLVSQDKDSVSQQRFEVIKTGDKQYKILNEATGKAVQFNGESTSDLTWEFVDAKNGYYYIRTTSGAYLKVDTSDDNAIVGSTYSVSDAQKWKLTESNYQPVTDGVYGILSGYDSVTSLNVNNMSVADGSTVGALTYTNGLNQQFRVTYAGKGYYRIVAENSGKSLQVAGSTMNSGASLEQRTISDSRAQLWKFIPDGSGGYYIRSKLGTALYLHSNGTSVLTSEMADSTRLTWNLKESASAVVEDGCYTLINKKNDGYALASTGGNVQVNRTVGYIEQKYQVEQLSSGYCKITNEASGKAVTLQKNSSGAGVNIGEADYTGADTQLWRLVAMGDGSYAIKSKCGSFLVGSGSMTDGSNAVSGLAYSSSAQGWTLQEAVTQYEHVDSSVNGADDKVFEDENIVRLAGQDRYATAILAAKLWMKARGKSELESVIVASGKNFPDALSASFLSFDKMCPIVLYNDTNKDSVEKFLFENVASGGSIYIIGGKGAISPSLDKDLEDSYRVKRVYGGTRYDTNLAILREAEVSRTDIIVCSGEGFADSLSSSASGKPILIVGDNLTSKQTEFLNQLNITNIYIIGGTGAVSAAVERDLQTYSQNIVRLAGLDRYSTSVAVARGLFGADNDTAVLSYGRNFPDGLSGGALATTVGAPLILADGSNYLYQAVYGGKTGVNRAIVMGGSGLIPDNIVRSIVQ